MIKQALYLISRIHIWIVAAVLSAFITGMSIGYHEIIAAIIFGIICTTVIIICDVIIKKIINNLTIKE